ncbi:hypothetical protein [Kineococcus indalonis]|uniref:hypothetical protein n=1 Tax=Kineococcus indalonis TaxID=2696566 RepID=UPI001411E59A|nr:hypothetical protein [Kineococcus indalonis]NAZ84634.1 hypothetical protein [Kineococcus indalonis]
MTDLSAHVEVVELPTFAKDHSIGDLVTLHPDYVGGKHDTNRVYEITKRPSRAGERNYTGTPLDGGQGLRGAAQLWKPYTGDAAAARAAAAANTVVEPDKGAVVTIDGPTSYPDGTRFVVFDVRERKARLIKLGGDGGRYLRNVAVTRLRIVDPSTLQPVQRSS